MVSIVIGSWGSYNECNERALGSKWIDLSDYESWEEIEDELKNTQKNTRFNDTSFNKENSFIWWQDGNIL